MRRPVLHATWKFFAGFVIVALVALDPAFGLERNPPNVAYAQSETAESTPATAVTFPGKVDMTNPLPVVDMGPALQYAIRKDAGLQMRFGALMGAISAINLFTQTVAYDTAEWVANGFAGQAPGFWTDPFGEYTQNLVLDSVGEFMYTFTAESKIPFDLCKPPLFPELSLDIALGLPGLTLPGVGRPRGHCPWTDLVANWGTSYQSLSNADVTRNINASFSTGGNDLSFGLGAHLGVFDKVAEVREAGILQRLEGSGFKPASDFISGQIMTPAQMVEANLEYQTIQAPGGVKATTDSISLNAAFGAGLTQIGVVAASTFTNVLVSKLLKKLFAFLKPLPGRETHALPDLANPYAAGTGATKPKELFQSQYSDLLTPQITRLEDQDLVTELSVCASQVRGKWNCTIDESLALGLRQGALTVRQAIDQGFINENWQLIPSTRLKDNQDPTCRSRAFCVANLRKMRLARIIPVGWELAADSPANQGSCSQAKGCVTLREVISKFDACNAQGELDKNNPYCHLIDPNWVLTAFPAQCQTKGYSNSLFQGQRMEECQDTALCLERDADGKCTGGFGYCQAEQTFWQFSAPKCEEQFASCRSYTPRGANAKPVGYLRSTLDYGSCNESNVGCVWYAQKRAPGAADTDSGWNNGFASTTDRLYFDKTMLPCDATNDGCTSLRRITAGQPALNLIQNGSFESATGTPVIPDGWKNANTTWSYVAPAPDPSTGTPAQDGAQSLYPPVTASQGSLTQAVTSLRPLRQYVLSVYARRYINPPDGTYVKVELFKTSTKPGDIGAQIAGTGTAKYFRSEGCAPASPSDPPNQTASIVIPGSVGNEWARFVCSFVTTPDTGSARVTIASGSAAATTPLIDGVKLEEAEVATSFQEGLNQSLEPANLKIPPDELNCQGADSDNALCKNFARVCKQTEAGCQGYRSLGAPTLPEVPAVLTPKDMCPAECVGYAEFRKQASTFDLVRDLDPRLDDPEDDTIAAFIPSTANSCAAQDVGCERFTNLEALALGGESEQAFNYLRACEKPGADSQTYYTWEGSDTTGYQLKTWSLKRDTTLPLPQPPKVIVKAGADGFIKDPLSCNQVTYIQAQDPDCRQFYDPEGSVFYRYDSQTVLSTEDCRQYRKEGSTQADCEKTGGTFIPASNQCLYLADQTKSSSCDIANTGCRAYLGTQGKVQEEVLSEDFTSASSTALPGANTKISQSSEAVLFGDKSLKVEGPSDVPNNAGKIIFPVVTVPNLLYELTFWAKTTDPARPTVTAQTTDQNVPFGEDQLEVDWKTFRLGPFVGATSTSVTTTQITLSGFPKLSFIDKVRVSRVQDVTYVIKDSWDTPAICDRTPEGVPQPQAMLGCQTYVDRNQKQVNARQFTRLCKDTAIGCTAFVNTRNTDTPYQTVWEKDAPAEGAQDNPPRPAKEVTVREADRYDYYIDDKSKACSAQAVSCRAFGLPQFTQDRTSLDKSKPFKTVYLMDEASKYDEGLCSEKELFCESFTSVAGTDYFRAPADHACEYRKAVVIDASCNVPNTAGATFDGWFKLGTTCPCSPDLLKGGGAFGIRYTGDPGYNAWTFATSSYRGWTGTCPDTQAECTEFRDVADKSDPLHPLGRPYFVVRDNSLDITSCNGQVDPARGCVLFRDLSDTRLLYSTVATNREYKARAYQPVGPINCESQPNHPACQAKVCSGWDWTGPSGAFFLTSDILTWEAEAKKKGGEDCVTDNDCKAPLAGVGAAVYLKGKCGSPVNDVNVVVKVKPDRACSEWLACSSGETVYDPQQGKYKSICTDLKLCNKAGEPEGAGIPYCSNYVDRKSANELLRTNIVLDAKTYSSRPTGFGQRDYGGITIPDQFQLVDAKLTPIGAVISPSPQVKSKFKKDYRLAVPVPFKASGAVAGEARPATADELKSLTLASEFTDKKFGDKVCVLIQNGSFGVLNDGKCWVSMDQGQPPQLGGAGAPIISDNLNALNLSQRFEQDREPQLDQVLSRSFPNTQCKAAPQGDAPFGNEFVVEWDDTVTPARPRRVAEGYGQVNLCEFGEDCACTYKRVTYGGQTRFYEPLSTNVLNAVCVGGPKEGLPCTLDRGIKGSSTPSGTLTAEDSSGKKEQVKAEDTVPKDKFTGVPPDQGCGEGGVCTPITQATLVRGVTGQCLQYDASRVVAGDQTRNECLLWNPNPVLAGPGDQFHWSPAAGWKPPISSGRYYCTSPVRSPQTFQITPGQTYANPLTGTKYVLQKVFGLRKNSGKTYAGAITTLSYSDDIASDKSCLDFPNPFGDSCDGNESGGSLDGALADGTDMGLACENADDVQSPTSDANALRIVTTGKGGNRSYAEYAILLDTLPLKNGKPSADGKISESNIGRVISGSSDKEVVRDNTFEDTISNFTFSTDSGKLGCEYSAEFGDAQVSDYDDRDGWYPQDQKWRANFKAEMAKSGNKLDRKNASIVTEDGSPSGVPVKVKCENPENGEECFLKVWTLDYKAEGMEKFQAFGPDIGRQGMDNLSKSPVYGKCDSDHAWFSIRAVFEDASTGENAKGAEDVKPESLAGPFQLIGFWVTACSPYSGPRYIYMYVKMGTADVCRELAETISKDSHDNAAFTDRNSDKSGFSLPRSGFTWGATNVPFGASLATGDAGVEPLYMEGVKQAASNPLHPPVFTFPGQTYFRPEKYPTSNWGMLSNVFARIYRIYGYNSRGVSRDDWACTDPKSPNFGQWCPNLGEGILKDEEKQALSQQYCGLEAKCVKGGTSAADVFSQKVCNSFSGVNRGLDCTNDPDVCHTGPQQLDETDGILRPEYSSCDIYQVQDETWTELTVTKKWRCTGSGCPSKDGCMEAIGCARAVAIRSGAFRCGAGSVRAPDRVKSDEDIWGSFCTKPVDRSPECPAEIQSEACIEKSSATGIGKCQSHQWAECAKDEDCHFYARNAWPSGSVNDIFLWSAFSISNAGNWLPKMQRPEPTPMFFYGWTDNFFVNKLGFPKNCPDGTNCPFRNAFPPGSVYDHTDPDLKFFAHPLVGDVDGRAVYTKNQPGDNYNDTELLKLAPGFSPFVAYKKGINYCSANFHTFSDECSTTNGSDETPAFFNALRWVDKPESPAPYGYFEENPGPCSQYIKNAKDEAVCTNSEKASPAGAKARITAHYGACESLALMYREGAPSAASGGTCRGGARAGQACQSDLECRPVSMQGPEGKKAFETLQEDSKTWCKPVTGTKAASGKDSSPPYGKSGDNTSCWEGDASAANSPFKQEDSRLDNNICTHPPGYWPRPNFCKDPNDEYCGLFGYDLTNPSASVNDGAPLPTDVTAGLYTPTFLNPGAAGVKGTPVNYNYVEYYNPAPPQVAAPDMRTCTGGQCRVAGLGSVSLDGLNEGVVNGGAGGHVAALRFYAWAAHDQMPLRRVVIDWGDGNQTELPDAFMKNRKPYCQTEKECTLASGLTCESDADCPPGAGTCESYGTCSSRPNVKCYKDTQCDFGGEKGVCDPRTFFGNDQDACDQQYFEFRHAYACLTSNKPAVNCPATSGACSSNPSIACDPGAAPGSSQSADTKCAKGDRCVVSLASQGGCFDDTANTCRFTPRVFVADNWGWCTGECRNNLSKSGVLIDVADAPIRHPYGGCFDASSIKSNADQSKKIGDNECALNLPAPGLPADPKRPWIVFPGAMQLLSGETK